MVYRKRGGGGAERGEEEMKVREGGKGKKGSKMQVIASHLNSFLLK